jgi:hypothetical protein
VSRPERLRHSKLRDDESDDADTGRAGGWPKAKLLEFDNRFRAALLRAHPELARATPNHVPRVCPSPISGHIDAAEVHIPRA